MKIAILHPSYEASSAPFKNFDPECNPQPYLSGHDCERFYIAKAKAVRQVTDVARRGFDVAVNLCDGAWDEDRAGIEVVAALERLNVAFTGAGSAFYDPSRVAMKMACHSVGVLFPAYTLARDEAGAESALAELRFPMIVKHPNSYSSVGLTPDSRVTDANGLRREAARMIEHYGAALIEEFIEGREFSVLVAEPRDESEEAWALAPIEFQFPEGESFKHFDLKWKDFGRMQERLVDDRVLAERLREASALTFSALGGTGYGRCDLRMNAAGEIYLLEINPNCGIFYPEGAFGSADFILSHDPAGHRGFLDHLLRCALNRRARAVRPWELRHRRAAGFGMFATRSVVAGETVERYEERLHALVSRGYVESQWRGMKREWFERYAWPLTDCLHVLWSENPEEWRPINHSCDPNTWLEGLNLTARRDIASGEELTVDYATFCGPSMAGFECLCGAPDCRRVILGNDFMLPSVRDRYGDHVSDFVRAARRDVVPEVRPPYEIVKSKAGFSLLAKQAWQADDVVSSLSWGKRHRTPSRWTLQVETAQHAEPLPFEFRYVNHSCAPNVLFDLDRGAVRALTDIRPGDEIRCFYPSTEWIMADPFDCSCGSPQCLGRIAGAADLPEETLRRYELTRPVQARMSVRTTATGSF